MLSTRFVREVDPVRRMRAGAEWIRCGGSGPGRSGSGACTGRPVKQLGVGEKAGGEADLVRWSVDLGEFWIRFGVRGGGEKDEDDGGIGNI